MHRARTLCLAVENANVGIDRCFVADEDEFAKFEGAHATTIAESVEGD